MTGTNRHRVIMSVYAVLRRDGRTLLMRRYNTGHCDGQYGLPAGHVDGGESALTATIREAKEEAGITIRPGDLELAHTMHRMAEDGTHERIDLYFIVRAWRGEPRVMEPHKCDDAQWFPETALPANVVPVVRTALRHIAAGEPYSDVGF